MPPFQGLSHLLPGTQGVALGWLVCGPLALSSDADLRVHDGYPPALLFIAAAPTLSAGTLAVILAASLSPPANFFHSA